MANWKENGVVPDSEDEEEFDSQSTTDYEKRNDPADDEFHDIDDVLANNNDTRSEDERLQSNIGGMAEPIILSQASSVDMIQPFDTFDGESVFSPKEEVKEDFAAGVTQDRNEPAETECTSLGQSTPEQLIPEAEVDEISRSWVRALSPASSILSSPPRSPIRSSPVAQPLSSPVQGPILPNHPEGLPEETSEQTQLGLDPLENRPRRQFRERKPVQMHPYLLEQQRYERRLKASNLKPVRITPSQERDDRRKRVIHGPELWDTDFQDPDEVEMAVTEESQPMTLDRGSPSPSTSADSIHETMNGPENSTSRQEEEGSDHEFPDLPDLFRQKLHPGKPKEKKSSKKYSNKNRPRPPSPARYGNKNPTLNIYDFPDSSPTSSPPIRPGNSRRPVSRVVSITSSTDSAPVWLDQSSPQLRPTTDVHTPLTSAIKASSHTSPTRMILGEDDPFADPIEIPSSPSACSSSPSSSEEEDEMVSLKKRIKHVLPASHLRLDRKRKEKPEPKLQARSNQKLNEKRAGVALPLVRKSNAVPSTQPANQFAFLESDESDGPDKNSLTGFPMDDDERTEALSIFQESDMGFALEDDRVDGMLPTPSRKRKSKNSFKQPNAKRSMKSSYSGGRQQSHSYQPRITSHLAATDATALKINQPKRRRHKRVPPKLSIIDVAENSGHFEQNAPAFLKVAARSARSRKELGRQSPTQKFIRLATREDTADAQSVLQDWRNRRIQPRNVSYVPRSENPSNAYPLTQISGNHQTKLPPPIAKLKTTVRGPELSGNYTNTRKIRVPRVRQLSMNDFVANRDAGLENSLSNNIASFNLKTKQKAQPNPYFKAPFARSAQLEAKQFPVNTLEPRKKNLDALFRMRRQKPFQQGNLQLSRFLADDDIVYSTVESNDFNEDNEPMPISLSQEVVKQPRRRKRLPKRIDAGAVVYRQPSEPLISEFLTHSLGEIDTDQGKLLGLGKFGTRYPHHFDILPLQAGIYFHETTFLGSGRLANTLSSSEFVLFDDKRPATSIGLGDKVFVWGTWNESVSEQIGVCVDWLTEHLTDTSQLVDRPDLIATTVSILDYVQHSINFSSAESRADFLLRMLEILQDFSSNLNSCRASIPSVDQRQNIEVTTRILVLSLRLLRMSRAEAHASTLRLEDVLIKLASSCIGFLILPGFETVRKMYDDLQYLSVRENGIRNDRFLAESWIVVIHVLGAAKIPRASFWDVANIELGIKSISSLQNANTMENLWLSMFSLLPLFEFDEHGYISFDSRQKHEQDNWPLAQQLIKRVFALYATNARQSPSFNDYCRAIASRCHYLMSKWGWWKCSGIIGTLFDCFALQKLANLRNEEVYKSPQFLEDLTTETLLDVEPEDRCFHIFLKVLAIAIKHQRVAGDTKGIRNLVARILPNHDRQFPKEEAIYHSDLASLRNHHDLLCTVYWAAPPGYGPSITLLQKLVSAARSHNEAFLINLRAWERLARYTLSCIPSSFPIESYKPFITWQDSFFNSLLEEYVELTQVRRQLQIQSDGTFQTDVDCNRKSTMSCIQAVARSTIEVLKCSNSTTLKHAVNLDMLVKMFSTGSLKDKIDQELTSSAIEILACYLHQLYDAEPESKSEESPAEDEEFDSQGLECEPEWAKYLQFADDYIRPLDRTITLAVRDSIRGILHDGPFPLRNTTNYFFIERLTKCWAQLTSIFIKFDIYSPKDFLTNGANAIFEHREQSHCTLVAWPLFLSELLDHKKSLLADIPAFDIGEEWMVAVSKPQYELRWENALTYQLSKRGHFLLSGWIIKGASLELFREIAPSATTNQQFIKDAITTMQKIFSDKTLLASTFGNVTRDTIKARFSGLLNSTMLSMQHHLQRLQHTDAVAHEAYVAFVQEIVSQIRSHCSDICPLLEFFFRRSPAYWPSETDPTLYQAGLTSYTLQLSSQRDKTRNGLIYYLWNGFRSSLSATNALGSYTKRISEGARRSDMLEFLLTDIVPAALEVAFENEAGWLACEIYLVAVSRSFEYLALSGHLVGQVMTHMRVMLQHMFNNIGSHYGRFGHSVEAVHPSHQGIITVIFRFWRACRPHLYNLNTAADNGLDEIFECFDGFVEAVEVYFKTDTDINLRFRHFDIGKVGNDVAIKEMRNEVQSNWRINMANGGVDVKMNDGAIVNHCFTGGPKDLREVLEGLLPSSNIQKAGAALDCFF